MKVVNLQGRRTLRGIPAACLAILLALSMSAGCSPKERTQSQPAYHEDRGDRLYEKGDLEGALKEYVRARDTGSQKLKVHNNLGNVYYRLGKYELAEKNYRMALGIDPAYLFSLNNLALTLERERNGAEAKRLLREALVSFGSSALLYNTLGHVLVREGDTSGGVEALRKAVEINPDYAIALNNLGDVYLKNPGLGEDPLPYILRAIEKDPDNKLFYDALGWYYCRAGVFDEALLALGKAFVQDPDNVEIRVHYATVLEWLGKTREALEQWQAIMDLPGDRELTTEARRHYWELRGR